MAKKISFEDHMARLRDSIAELEQSDTPLDDSLKSFETAVSSYRACRKYLNEFEQKIQVLSEDSDGDFQLKPFGGSKEEK